MDDERPWRALWVSAVLGGGGAMRDVDAAIRALAGLARRQEERLPAGDQAREAVVDVTFHVPGTMLRPDYEGIRTGRWVAKRRLQVIQVAVPLTLTGTREINAFLAESVVAAVELASERATEKKRAASFERAREIAKGTALALLA